jgi:hypothetical protein
MTLGGGLSRRTLALGALVLITFTVGFLSQGALRIGATPAPVAVSAIATDVIGETGSRQPVRVQISIAVANLGPDQVRVIGPGPPASGVNMIRTDPSALVVPGGRQGLLNADVSVRCDLPQPLALPELRIELTNGGRRQLAVGGSGVLLEACSHAAPEARPLAVATTRVDGEHLVVELTSPTGRRAVVSAVRAGGKGLVASPLPVIVPAAAARTRSTVRLTAPQSCPTQWQVEGIPGSLAFDLAAAADSGPVTMIQIRLGSVLTSWLLATSCRTS